MPTVTPATAPHRRIVLEYSSGELVEIYADGPVEILRIDDDLAMHEDDPRLELPSGGFAAFQRHTLVQPASEANNFFGIDPDRTAALYQAAESGLGDDDTDDDGSVAAGDA